MQKLVNKNIIITGASSGLGKEIAFQSAAAGANVFLLARSIERLQKIKKQIEEAYQVKVYCYQLDVSNGSQIEEVFTNIERQIGTVDVLVNNAGFGLFEEVINLNLDEAKRMLDVNVYGLIACTKMVVPSMVRKKAGHIINIASQAGKVATPKSSVYAATKHAVLGFTNSLRLEMSEHNVFVTSVNPGPIASQFFDIADSSGSYVNNVQKYMLKPEHLAKEIISCMLHNKREINRPRWMNVGAVFYSVFPRTFEGVGKKFFFKK